MRAPEHRQGREASSFPYRKKEEELSELEDLTRRVQEAVGFTGADLDGQWGLKTAHAVVAKLTDGKLAASPTEAGQVLPASAIDERSLRNIATLQQSVRP